MIHDFQLLNLSTSQQLGNYDISPHQVNWRQTHFYLFSKKTTLRETKKARRLTSFFAGGGGGIRTPGTLSSTPVFKTGALNQLCHSSLSYPATDFCDRKGRFNLFIRKNFYGNKIKKLWI